MQVESEDITFTAGKKTGTATLTVGTSILTSGKYIVEVTPYLEPTDTVDSQVIGDSAKATKVMTLTLK